MTMAERAKGEFRVIGKRLPKVGGPEMTTGQARYGADIYLPGMLHAKALRSPHVHAIIKRIDTSKALALQGVKAVATGADFPDVPKGTFVPIGELQVDLADMAKLIIARDKVIWDGHPVAAVAATDPFIAEEALKLIEVDYEVLEPVLDVLDAMKPGAPVVDDQIQTRWVSPDKPYSPTFKGIESTGGTNVSLHMDLETGDIEKGFAEADLILEKEYRCGIAHQGYIEPKASTVKIDADGHITVWTSTQGHFSSQMTVAGLLNIPQHQITVIATELGGGFGGKGYAMAECMSVVLARKSGRPVKLVQTREETLRGSGPASASVIRAKAGCKKDGRLTALKWWVAVDAGCKPGAPLFNMLTCPVAPYKIENMRLEGYDVVTNKVRVQAYRAPGAPPAHWAMEQTVDALAAELGIDPLDFRMRNSVDDGDVRVPGQVWEQMGLQEVLRRVKSSDHWNSKLEGPNRGRGVALGFWHGAIFNSGADISVHTDGTATLKIGAVDMTGTRGTLLQMAAEMLDLEPDQVSVVIGDTDSAAFADPSGGSRITYTMSVAIERAVQDLFAQLRPRAAERLKAPQEELEYSNGCFLVKGSPEETVHLKDLVRDGDGIVTGSGSVSRLPHAVTFGAHIADVEVDPDTGRTQLLRYTTFQDCGRAINPTRVEAQMQGGATQGIGWALTEEYIYDGNGRLSNASLLDYRQPTALDLPMIDCEIIEVPAPVGPFGVRGVGEVSMCPAPGAVANAVANAAGVRVTEMPMTMERLFWAMQAEKKG